MRSRPHPRRQPLRGVRARRQARLRLGLDLWLPGRAVRNNGILFSRRRRRGDSSSCVTYVRRWCSPQHHRFHGRIEVRARRTSATAKLINAVSNSEVSHFNLMVGASHGAGNWHGGRPRPAVHLHLAQPQDRDGRRSSPAWTSCPQRRGRARGITSTRSCSACRKPGRGADRQEETALYATGRMWTTGSFTQRQSHRARIAPSAAY